MTISVKGRDYFEDVCGTPKEAAIMAACRIISVNSVRSHEDPPFSRQYWNAENVLVLRFDDVEPEDFLFSSDDTDEEPLFSTYHLMTESDAEAIVRFVQRPDPRPIMIHCTAGISRSGAIGVVLNEYYNRKLAHDEEAHETFLRLHAFLCPNLHVMKLLWKRLGLHETPF